MKKVSIRNPLLLLTTAVVWGVAFVAQSVGMDYVGPFTFNFAPGTRVLIRKMAPLGDPIEIYLRGYELTLRKEDAQRIQIEPVSSKPQKGGSL